MSEPRDRSPPPGPSRQGESSSFWRSGRAALSLVFGSPLASFILCTLAFVAAFLFQVGPDIQQLAFLASRQTRLWHVIFALQPVLWVAATLILWGEFRGPHSLWPGTRRERMAVMFCSSVALVMISLPFVAQFSLWPATPAVKALGLGPLFDTRALTISIMGAAVAGLLTSSLFCVHVQLLGQVPGDLDDDVLRYLRLQARSRRLLGLAAFNIGLSILSVGILRNLLNEAFSARPELFPSASVVGFGFYFTGLIASLYFPIRRTLADVGEALADRLIRQTLGAGATWKERSQEQQAARAYLGLRESAFQELQQGLSVLAPLLASLSSLAFGTGV